MLGSIIAYVAALVLLYNLIPDVLDGMRLIVGDTVFYGFTLVPFGVILVFSTLPSALRARRQYRLSRQKFAWRASEKELFRLHPYGAEDQTEYRHPGGEDENAVKWVKATPHSVNYLCGPSGVGKSSLIHACLLPRLEVTGWRTAVVRVDADPVERIRHAVVSIPDLLHNGEANTLPLPGLLAAVSKRIGQSGQPPLLIVIDQFEEFLILNDAADRRPLSDFLRGLADAPLKGIRLLLVFRSDYRELLFKLKLPRFLPMETAFQLAPFRRDQAQGFLERGGLSMSETGLDALFQGLDRIEGLRGLYRLITLNMVGLVMKRTPDDRITDPSRLIERYLLHCLADSISRDLVRGVLACMITAEGTKEPRRLVDLASLIRLDIWKIEATLCEMESAGLVRSTSPDRDVWEVSHDFLARQIGFLLGRLRRPWLQRYSAPVLVTAMASWAVTIAVTVVLVWPGLKEEKALNELAKMGFSRTAETGNHTLILRHTDRLTDADFARFGRLVADLSEPVIEVNLWNTTITDLAPLKGMPLTRLELTGADGITDLTPLKGMPLTLLDLRNADSITDLAPLKDMPLMRLDVSGVEGITDLTPLKDMPLTQLLLTGCDGITDLTPLKDMPLTLLNLHDADGITDLTPLNGMPLTQLLLGDADGITDLAPLKGMPLTRLELTGVEGITDLTPLKDMPLTRLELSNADGITDFTPLKGMPLTQLDLRDADNFNDLSPLEGMPLTQLKLAFSDGITDLSPLKGMPLTQLVLLNTDGITDLTPLKGMPLTQLDLTFSDGITDLSPLKGIDPSIVRGASEELLATLK